MPALEIDAGKTAVMLNAFRDGWVRVSALEWSVSNAF